MNLNLVHFIPRHITGYFVKLFHRNVSTCNIDHTGTLGIRGIVGSSTAGEISVGINALNHGNTAVKQAYFGRCFNVDFRRSCVNGIAFFANPALKRGVKSEHNSIT